MIRLGFGRRREPPQLDEQRWQRLLSDYPFAQRLGPQRLARLRTLCAQFLSDKRFSAEAGLELTDHIGSAIALQACVPIVELGLDWYDDFQQIIVYPDQFEVPRTDIDEAGVVHEEQAWLAGESIAGGPVVLSWADVAAPDDPTDCTVNVVIHEFVHKLDLRDGQADGRPPLPAPRRQHWDRVLDAAYEDFVGRPEALERSMPRWLDPESPAADDWYRRLPLDPYAAQDRVEFFAVSGEAFFLAPGELARAFPDYFGLLVEFFRFDPRRP